MLANLDLNSIIAILGVLSAVMTGMVALLGMRYSRDAFSAKDAQIANLQQQVQQIKDISPDQLHKHLIAVKEGLSSEIDRLKIALTESNDLLRRRSAEVSEEKRAIASIFGQGRLLFGIADSELMIRNLYSLVFTRPGMPVDYGELQLSVCSFYIKALRLMLPNEDAIQSLVKNAPEWILDYLILPVLSCMRYKLLRNTAEELLQQVCDQMKTSPFAHEVPIYEAAIERAHAGEAFLDGVLPKDLQKQMDESRDEAERKKLFNQIGQPNQED